MDVHKPKPWHNWREFLKELGTIALGVGIALAAEQGVEWLHWRGQVAAARETIATEMANNIRFSIQRMRMGGCLASRLLEIEKILAEASRTGMLPPLGPIGSAGAAAWPSSAWESVVASQTATHFPRQQLASISLAYARVQRIENWNRQELEEWSILSGMGGPSRRFDPALGAEWQKALALAILHNTIITRTASSVAQAVQSLNLPFAAEERHLLAEAKTAPLNTSGCTPLGAVPALPETRFLGTQFREIEKSVESLPYGRQP